MAVTFSNYYSAFDPGLYLDGTTTFTTSLWVAPMNDVANFLQAAKDDARQRAVSAFWGSERKAALAEYDRLTALYESLTDGQSKIKDLEKQLASAKKAAPRRVAPTTKKRGKRR